MHRRLRADVARVLCCIAIALTAIAAVPAPAPADTPAGAHDPGFAGGGVQLLEAASASAAGGGIQQATPDGLGGMVGAGHAIDVDTPVLSVVHRDASGAPIAAFGGGDGEARVAFPGASVYVLGIGRQSGGRTLVLVGDLTNRYLVALTAAGGPDTGFAADGIRALDATPAPNPSGLALDPLGRILLSGDPAGVMRLTAAGAVDPTFGDGGVAPVALPADSAVLGAIAGVGGDVVVAVVLRVSESFFQRGAAVAHLTVRGERDLAFGDDGLATVADTNTDFTQRLLLRPTGTILFAESGRVHALTPSGDPDAGFSDDGLIDFGAFEILDIALDGIGRLYVARDSAAADGPELMRYGTDGTADAGFGERTLSEISAFSPILLGEATGVLVAGSAVYIADRPLFGSLGLLSRITTDGSRDPLTGPTGTLVAMGQTTSGAGAAVAAAPGGRAVLTGYADENERRRVLVARVLSDGTPDPSFGAAGRVLLESASSWIEGRAVALDGDRPVVLAQSVVPNAMVVARLTAAGVPDASFGPGGRREVEVAGTGLPRGLAIAVDGAGRVLVAGCATIVGQSHAFVVRLLANGEPDPAFSADGSVLLAPPGNQYSEPCATRLAFAPGGEIVVAGNLSEPGISRGFVTRLGADGTIDGAFADGGYRSLPLGPDLTIARIGGMAIGDGGAILLAAFTEAPPAGLRIVRLTASGGLDSAFGPGGVVNPGVGIDDPLGLVRDAAGRLVIPTTREPPNAFPPSAVVRLAADGTPDASFDGDGRAVLAPELTFVLGGGAVVRPDGGITVAGSSDLTPQRGSPRAAAVLGLLGAPIVDPSPPPAESPPPPAPPPGSVPQPPPPPTRAAPAQPPPPTPAAVLELTVGVPGGQTRSSARRRGLRLKATCTPGCRLTVAATTRRGGRSLGTARRTAELISRRAATITVRLPARARSALARRGRATVAARVSALTSAGARRALTRTVTLTR